MPDIDDPTSDAAPLSPLLLNRKTAARLLAIGLTKLDGLLRVGLIASVKIGRSTMISMTELQRFIDSLPSR